MKRHPDPTIPYGYAPDAVVDRDPADTARAVAVMAVAVALMTVILTAAVLALVVAR